MRVPDPISTALQGMQRLSDGGAAWLQAPLRVLEQLPLPLGLRIPLAALLILLGLLLLRRLTDLLPACQLLLDRLRELGSRLWRLGLALLAALLWVDPERRLQRHARRRRGGDGELSLPAQLLELLLDLICLPLDWLAGLGWQRLLRADPATEAKEERRRREPAGLRRRLAWVLADHLNIQLLLSVLRLLLPRLWLPALAWRRVLRPDSYGEEFPINGMLWLSLNADVREVLERPETFEVVYGPRMRLVTRPVELPTGADAPVVPSEHGNFLLGMQNTPRYWRDSSIMRLAFRREDGERCRRLAEHAAREALRRAFLASHDATLNSSVPGNLLNSLAPGSHGSAAGLLRLNLPGDLVIPVVEVLVNDYFGIPVPLRCRGPQSGSTAAADGSDPLRVDHGHRWLEVLFNHIFYDIRGERSRSACERDAPLVRSALQELIRRRRHQLQNGVAADADDVLSRCLRLQRSGTPGLDDETLRVNLTGFLVGAMTPLINATCQVVEVLLQRPAALRQSMAAARSGDPLRLQACVMEALRFWPGDPVIWRWTNADSWIGAGSRRCAVPRGTLVMAWNASAMFDPALVADPWAFRCDRPPGSYLHWGHGQHSCAGAYLNMAVIPGLLGPLLSQRRLQRAAGAAGRPTREGADGLTFRRFELLVRPAVHGAAAAPCDPG